MDIHQAFNKIVESCVKDLQERFRDGLEEKCQVGATNVCPPTRYTNYLVVELDNIQASAVAVEVSDSFASRMHWATYRASMYKC